MSQNFNILLDPLPEEWKGKPIDSDFQIGIQIIWVMEDKKLSGMERWQQAGRLLFPEEMPETLEEVAEAVNWFMHGWQTDHYTGRSDGAKTLDFQMDQWRIWTAFLQQYRINLNTDKVHFWEFMGLLNNLNECTLNTVEEIRAKKLTGSMSKEERKYYTDAKKVYAIKDEKPKEYTEEEQEAIDEFDRMREKMRGKKVSEDAGL